MFDPLLGFMVLSLGALVPLGILVIGVVAMWFVVRRMRTTRKKCAADLITALIIVLIPTWDVIAGRIHFNHLCATESGIRIYKHVKLDPEFADVQFPDSSPAYERMPVAKIYPYGLDSSEDLPGPARIKFSRESIRDARTGETKK